MKRNHRYLVLLLIFVLAAAAGGSGVPVLAAAGVADLSGVKTATTAGALPAAGVPAAGEASCDLPAVIKDTAAFLVSNVPEPQLGATGGEWTIIALARSNCPVPEGYFDSYYQRIAGQVKSQNGVLHDKKYTEYSRLVLALTAIGRDPSNVSGYNLLQPLGDYEKTTWQGINGAIFALLALDSAGYEIPSCPGAAVPATRDMYVAYILEQQVPGGGFSLSGNQAEADVTAMALQALARYDDRTDVQAAIASSLACLSSLQNSQGGYESWGDTNLESTAQVLMALCELGIGIDDGRFVKNGHTLVDAMLGFYTAGQGFQHTENGNGVGGMATEQALCALASWQRVSCGQTSLYHMTNPNISAQSNSGYQANASEQADTSSKTDASDNTGNALDEQGNPDPGQSSAVGLPGRNPDVAVPPLSNTAAAFADIKGHPCQQAIEALAGRGIINGLSADSFAPDQSMTRAEFAAIVTRALGLQPSSASVFADVPADRWYAPYVGTACTYGIVGGTSAGYFSPELTITRQEAAVMVARAAKLCGLDTGLGDSASYRILSQFDDYPEVSPWAGASLAFCYQQDILPDDVMEIKPGEAVNRGEIADMLYRTLVAAALL